MDRRSAALAVAILVILTVAIPTLVTRTRAPGDTVTVTAVDPASGGSSPTPAGSNVPSPYATTTVPSPTAPPPVVDFSPTAAVPEGPSTAPPNTDVPVPTPPPGPPDGPAPPDPSLPPPAPAPETGTWSSQPLVLTATTDRREYGPEAPVHVTAEACNEDHLPHRDNHYRRHQFLTSVMNYWNDGAARLSPAEPESDHPYEDVVAPGECRTAMYTWDQSYQQGREPGEHASGRFRVHVLWGGSAHGADRPEAWSPWFELTDSPDGRPPPDDYREDPTFTLQVSTDRSSYAAGDDVVATVTACNTTDREQDHGYADYGDGVPPVTVDFVHHRDDGEAHPAATRGRGPPPHDGENGSYPTATMTFAPHQCRTWTFVWNQAWEHPPPDEQPGQLAPRGRYDAYATWDGDTWDGQPAGYHPEDRAPFELR